MSKVAQSSAANTEREGPRQPGSRQAAAASRQARRSDDSLDSHFSEY